ncbi:SDR family oxidoreductase [Microbacterium hibisci]|uniref:SDR family oxidoreductase n=1 Tax=Microbacterium hibisci TaxID=2036000 RepID=UPI001944AA8E|nr:SDR family oxidoreductase [Microbacterium hibisci]
MNIVVIGGTGLIGSRVVQLMNGHGHFAVAASPNSGVNTITGEGLAEAFDGADVVVDVSNSPSFADDDVMDFFTTSTRNQLDAEKAAGVGHHVALSIVGADRLPHSGYLRAKVAQEELIRASGQAFTIIRATQFFEFAPRIGDEATVNGVATLSTALMQPMAAADVSHAVARAAGSAPAGGIRDIGGPEQIPQDEFVRRAFAAEDDPRTVVGDPQALYFGTLLTGGELTPADGAELSSTTFDQWLAGQRWIAARSRIEATTR